MINTSQEHHLNDVPVKWEKSKFFFEISQICGICECYRLALRFTFSIWGGRTKFMPKCAKCAKYLNISLNRNIYDHCRFHHSILSVEYGIFVPKMHENTPKTRRSDLWYLPLLIISWNCGNFYETTTDFWNLPDFQAILCMERDHCSSDKRTLSGQEEIPLQTQTTKSGISKEISGKILSGLPPSFASKFFPIK